MDAGTYDGALYAAPYYAGGRIVFYTPQIVGDTLPTTLDEYVEKGKALKTDTVSGIYAPGKDWYNALPYVWAHGGEIAVQDGDEWDAQFSSDESLEGLEQLQDVYLNASVAPVDGNERLGNIDFCAGEVGFLSSPAWAAGNITGAWPWGDEAAGEEVSEGCPDTYGSDLGAFALPGLEAGETAPIFAGGSNVAVATKSDSPEKAKAALTIMLSEGYQKLLAEQGLTPGIKSAAEFLPDTPIAKAQAEALANSKFTPDEPELGRGRGRADHPRRARQDRAGRRRRGDRGRARHGDRGDPQQVVHLEGSGSRTPSGPLRLVPHPSHSERRRHERHRHGSPQPARDRTPPTPTARPSHANVSAPAAKPAAPGRCSARRSSSSGSWSGTRPCSW